MIVAGDWLTDPKTQTVLATLTNAGHQALVVGGCVRNAVLDVPVTDVDIATSARPADVIDIVTSAGLRAVPTGLAHGTVTVVVDGTGFEVTTFRRDLSTDGRHATVAFCDDIAADAARRDFTMNALYAEADGTVLDPLVGLPDALARHVRFVGDPDARIAEDYLRILRFFRFFAQYGDPALGLDADALAACAQGADGLTNLSAERVGAEVRKLLSVPDPAPAVAAMGQAGVLGHILPGADARALPVLVHLEQGRVPDWLRRLLVLGGDHARLRLTRAEIRDLGQMRDAIESGKGAAELGYRLGCDLAESAVLAQAAMTGAPLAEGWEAAILTGGAANFPLRARDFPHLTGADLGNALRVTEDRWIASGFALRRSDLLG